MFCAFTDPSELAAPKTATVVPVVRSDADAVLLLTIFVVPEMLIILLLPSGS
jgi:hypothetical protein